MVSRTGKMLQYHQKTRILQLPHRFSACQKQQKKIVVFLHLIFWTWCIHNKKVSHAFLKPDKPLFFLTKIRKKNLKNLTEMSRDALKTHIEAPKSQKFIGGNPGSLLQRVVGDTPSRALFLSFKGFLEKMCRNRDLTK